MTKDTMFSKLSILVLLLMASYTVKGQKNGQITSMHTFLQKNADSTLIFKVESNWTEPPVYSIISKKGDTITLYTYKSLFRDKTKIPFSIRDTIYKLKNYQDYSQSYSVGINKFFDARYIDDKSARTFWTSLMNLSPWQIKDDSIDGTGCKEYTREKYISDLGGISLFLITKNEIKHLYFYGPEYFEKKVCQSRKGRKAILEIQKLFMAYF